MSLILALTSFLLFPLAVCAQDRRAEAAHLRGDLFAGAAFNGSNPSNATTGFVGGVDAMLLGPMGGEAQVAVASTSNGANTITMVDYLAGPRISEPASRHVALFADLLIGAQTLNNSDNRQHAYYYKNGSGFASAGDAGADIRLTPRLALRGLFGFLFSNFAVSGAGPIGNYRWRAGGNVVYRF